MNFNHAFTDDLRAIPAEFHEAALRHAEHYALKQSVKIGWYDWLRLQVKKTDGDHRLSKCYTITFTVHGLQGPSPPDSLDFYCDVMSLNKRNQA